MVDPISEVQGLIPSFGIAGIMNFVTWIIIFLFVLVGMGIGTFFIIRKLRYKYKVVIFEKVGGYFEPTRRDRGAMVKHGEAGDQVFYLKKYKKYVPMPSIQTGRNTFWYFLREDQELINFGPGDFDHESRELGAKFLDKEMRYARTSLQGSFKDRYDKMGFFQKYAALLVNIAAITIIMVFLWLIVDKLVELIGRIDSVMVLAREVLEVTRQQIIGLDNLQSGSGMIQK